jgi:triacylglycerol esterase/lipase EstA (alpha/beta hydrolase family)
MPTRPCVIIPGFFAAATDYQDMANWLTQQGTPTTIVPLKQRDWWPTLGGRSMRPILQAIDQTVQTTQQDYNIDQINLIGHSAGGWIARIYLGAENYDVHGRQPDQTPNQIYAWNGHRRVHQLITLGSPHTSQERWTKKNLNFVNDTYPGAYEADVNYVCIAGKSVLGARRRGQWLAHNSYELTCGQGNTWGDGITPIVAAHLEGAKNLILDEVWHSPRSPGRWYGSPDVLAEWSVHLAD